MYFLKSLFVAAVCCAGCSDSGTTMQMKSDTSMRSIDSSKMINNTSRLPQDSTTTTVTQ